mmetsp:Transcript_21052/g.33880  ORF Transcript_21052/g.33880 Transcript_21052/m.33880 type:complete len:295 (+) Transcript_21052:62-946(+)|eukprot:CAMPEP_0178732598 /NCGR_PEP_ID=MMETSP0744-20121128/348_1 /TAXON_ID=913974 /ORGANISM="Nitzschia punctata, Strain CCMP561" /LENGTH=294 /DNA_ID=CAMNT_0020384727 /DNA_START=60 /DNA_END=944 /DNA_ORIENTATION=-
MMFYSALILPLLVSANFAQLDEQDTANCIDPTPYAINPEYLDILKGGGDLPDDAAVYFEFPSSFIGRGMPLIYCLEDILIPQSVGGKNCSDVNECYMAVGYRMPIDLHDDDDGHDVSIADYQCLCSGFELAPKDPSTDLYVNACGLSNEDNWGVTCPSVFAAGRVFYDENSTRIVSNHSSAYISLCPITKNECDVCNGGRPMPSFVVGVQWISDLEEQCFDDPFETYEDYRSPGLSAGAIAGIVVGSVLLVVAAGGAFLYFRKQKAVASQKEEIQSGQKGNDVEGQETSPKETS